MKKDVGTKLNDERMGEVVSSSAVGHTSAVGR